MKTPSARHETSRSRRRHDRLVRKLLFATGLTGLLIVGLPARAAPLTDLSFSEGSGTTTANAGSLADTGTFAQQNNLPVFSTGAPSGPYAPAGNVGSVDFGAINAGEGNRAIDFTAPLGPMVAFTACGWVNCRDLTVGSGGNRIVFALDAPAGRGFDLVHLASGALQLGINQWPDGTPALSSGGRITADANAGDANWVFFAATYDSTLPSGQVKFYFGNANTPAAFDVACDYDRGEIVASGAVTLGNFGTVVAARTDTANSRVFRGLMDEIKVFPEALTAEQLLVVQTNGTVTPTPPYFLVEPMDQKIFLGNDATFSAQAAGTPVIGYQWQRDNVDIFGATSNRYTVAAATLADSGAQFRVVVTSPYGSATSSNATLYVNTDVDPPTVLAVTTHRNLNRLTVTFSEPVEEQSGADYFNYIFSGDNVIATLSAVLQPDWTNVLLTTDPMLPGGSYTLTISAVKDRAQPIPNEMIATNWSFTAYTPPPRTVPLVETRFEEGFGSTVTNTGIVGGTGTIDFGVASSVPGLPVFAGNVPAGPFAPSGNNYSLYTGTGVGHAQYAGKAVDFPNEVRTNIVGLTEFTVTGWINVTDGTIGNGGNRIFTTWPQNVDGVDANRLTGVDVVMAANGTLRLGVNMAPDYPTPPGNIGPTSSTGKVGISPTGDPANWVFFAVTYDASLASDNAAFYFGDVNTQAAKDTGATLTTYLRGAIADCTAPVTLTLGNFMASAPLASTRDSTSNNRAFRGYMDEIRFFQYALTPEEIQQIQTLGGPIVQIPVGISVQPVNQLAFEGQSATFFASVTGSPPITVQWQRNGQDIPDATNLTLTLPQVSLADDGATFRIVASNALAVAVSDDATLQVLPEDGRKVRFTFEEGAGTTTTNLGNLLGYGAFAQQNTLPAFSSNVPLGPFAPTINAASVDFGTISAGEGGRAIDLTGALLPSLGAMDGFTVSGWLNARDLTIGSGGNRIVFALESPDGRGFDLVQLADGSMRLGVNQWPDAAGGGGPFSSTGKITVDPAAGPNNWVFFAVTYDSSLPSGQVNYYFGNPQSAAALDITADYDRGPLAATGPLTLGNFGLIVGARTDLNNSRVFRGLMDDINVFNRPLTLAEIQEIQVAGGPVEQIPVGISSQPMSQIVFEGQAVNFSAGATGSPPITVQWQRNGEDIPDATNLTLVLPQVATTDDGATFRLQAVNPYGTATSSDATLQVLPEDGRKVRFTFEEGTGTTTTNLGNLLGYGAFVQQNELPAFASNVPLGPFAPTGSVASVDFGPIAAGEGNRAIDLTATVVPSLGAMDGFTICGWVNARDLTIGSGGNRIVFGLETPNGRGFDLVQLADGSLRLGVNQWPDGSGGGGPFSSVGKITADPSAGPDNWVFFAVTYDSSLPSGQVSYYFGDPQFTAELDVTADYSRGPVAATGTVTLGNFGVIVGARTSLSNSRVFRGLMDDINIFNRPLAIAQIQMVQQGRPVLPTLPPLAIGRDDTDVVITWTADEALQLESREAVEIGDWTDVTETPDVNGTTYTVHVPIGAGNRFFRLRSQ